MIVGLTGLAGCGKSTAATELQRLGGFEVISLADPIKQVCKAVLGFTDLQLWGPSAERNRPDPRWGGLTPRRALQTLGTEWGREMHPDVWVRACLRRAEQFEHVVIPDVRFDNEAAAIRAAGGQVWLITRTGSGLSGESALHSSEAGVNMSLVTDIIHNNGTLEDLAQLVSEKLHEQEI